MAGGRGVLGSGRALDEARAKGRRIEGEGNLEDGKGEGALKVEIVGGEGTGEGSPPYVIPQDGYLLLLVFFSQYFLFLFWSCLSIFATIIEYYVVSSGRFEGFSKDI